MCKNMNAIKMNLNHRKLRSKKGGLLFYLQCLGEGLMQKNMRFICSGVQFMQKSILFSQMCKLYNKYFKVVL